MGSANVGLVYARWGHLPDRPFRLLAFMALVSMDEDDPPLFWGGRESLVVALGRMLPDVPAVTDSSDRAEQFRKARRADFEAVKNAMRPLFRVGVLTVQRESGPGQSAVYSLQLHAATGKAWPVEQGRLGLSTGKAWPVEQGRPGLPLTSKEPQDPQENTTSSLVTNSPAAVENGESKNDEFGYAAASEILQALPDFGGEYMTRVADLPGGMQVQVVTAARMALAERRTAS